MANVTAPNGFPSQLPGMRSGLAPRYYLGSGLDEQSRFIEASFKHSHSCWATNDRSTGVTSSTAGAGDPLLFGVRVPPYTRWMAWRVLTSKDGYVYAAVTGSARIHRLTVTDPPGTSDFWNSQWTTAWAVAESGSNAPTCLDVDNNTGEWTRVEVQVYVSGDVELFAVEFEPLRLSNVGSDIITT